MVNQKQGPTHGVLYLPRKGILVEAAKGHGCRVNGEVVRLREGQVGGGCKPQSNRCLSWPGPSLLAGKSNVVFMSCLFFLCLAVEIWRSYRDACLSKTSGILLGMKL